MITLRSGIIQMSVTGGDIESVFKGYCNYE